MSTLAEWLKARAALHDLIAWGYRDDDQAMEVREQLGALRRDLDADGKAAADVVERALARHEDG
jgi:hypothetical protein